MNQPNAPENTQSFATFLTALEDGVLNADMSEALRELNAAMNQHVQSYGGKAKGKISLTIEFKLDDGLFIITPDFKATLPKAVRRQSVAWSTPGNNFTPHNPRQMALFGNMRDVTSSSKDEIRNV